MAVGSTEQIGRKHCMTAQNFYVDVLDDYAFDIDETVELEVEFDLKAGAAGVELSYDANRPKNVTDGKLAVHGPVETVKLPVYAGGNRWYKKRFILERARFAGLGLFLPNDFYIGAVGGKAARICNIILKRSYTTPQPQNYGRLMLNVRDEKGVLVPVRVGLYDQTGRMPLPSDEAITVKKWSNLYRVTDLAPGFGGPWPVKNRRIFYIDGDYQTKIPAGRYQLVISRGMEYHFVQKTIEIKKDQHHQVNIKLDRWMDMPAKGWYSGDTHLHYSRNHAKDDQNILKHAMGEDLHVTNLLEMGTSGATYGKQYNWGKEAWYGKNTHYLVPGQEDPRTGRLGHTIHLNLSGLVRFPDQYFLFHNVFEGVKKQGGLTGFAHLYDKLLPVFNAVGGLAIDVPFGLVDLVEILSQPGWDLKSPWVHQLWFDFLNLGYKLAPMAGTDYMNVGVQPGAVRTYVKLSDGYSVQGWFDSLKAGRSFVTSGPMVAMTVNGAEPGAELKLKAGDRVNIEASSDILPDLGKLYKLELYEQGKLIATHSSVKGEGRLTLTYEGKVRQGTWFVLLAYAQGGKLDKLHAATAPVYISVGGDGFCKVPEVPVIATRMRDAMKATLDGRYKESVRWNTSEIDERQKKLLQARIAKANKIYDKIVTAARGGKCFATNDNRHNIK